MCTDIPRGYQVVIDQEVVNQSGRLPGATTPRYLLIPGLDKPTLQVLQAYIYSERKTPYNRLAECYSSRVR